MSETTTSRGLADPAARRELMSGVAPEPGSKKPVLSCVRSTLKPPGPRSPAAPVNEVCAGSVVTKRSTHPPPQW